MIVLLISALIVALAVLMLSVRIIFVRNGKFPETHIEGNKALAEKGIHCAKSMIREEEKKVTLIDVMRQEKRAELRS